jgi:hypothetical protein
MMGPVSEDRHRSDLASADRVAMGERLGGFIYGTILTLSVIIAGAKAYPDAPGRIAALVVATTIVFWLAHVYAHGAAYSIGHDKHLSLAVLGLIARREASILEASVPSVAALLAGWLGLFSERVSVWVAMALGLVVLAAAGLLFARAERLTWVGTTVVLALNLGLGFLLIGLKLAVSHH